MDEQRFDALARLLVGGASRRRALRALAGGALGPLLIATSGEGAAAACLNEGRPCKRGAQCCSGACQGKKGQKRCRRVPVQSICTTKNSLCDGGGVVIAECGTGALNCACVETTAGRAFCAENQNVDPSPCTSNAECDARVGQGAVCARVGTGCAATACLLPCPDPV